MRKFDEITFGEKSCYANKNILFNLNFIKKILFIKFIIIIYKFNLKIVSSTLELGKVQEKNKRRRMLGRSSTSHVYLV